MGRPRTLRPQLRRDSFGRPAAPRGTRMASAGKAPVDWWGSLDRQRWAARRVVAGSLTTLVGLVAIGGLVLLLARSDDPRSVFQIAWPSWLGLMHLVGIPFALGYRWSRFVLWPVSVLDLVVFPWITVVGIVNLWVLYNTRGHPTRARRSSRRAAAQRAPAAEARIVRRRH